MRHTGGEAAKRAEPPASISPRLRRAAVAVAVARYAIPLIAIPLVPILITEHLVLLVLLRPTKELLLVAGGVSRVQGLPPIWAVLVAYVPLMILAVWAFFVVGRAYGVALREGGAPRWLHRALRPHHVELAQRVITRRGPAIAVLGRLAAFPPTALAAAAGTTELGARRYLVADAIGALLAFAVTVGAGYALGEAWRQGARWLTLAGLVVFIALVALLTLWVRRDAEQGRLPDEPGPDQPSSEQPRS